MRPAKTFYVSCRWCGQLWVAPASVDEEPWYCDDHCFDSALAYSNHVERIRLEKEERGKP